MNRDALRAAVVDALRKVAPEADVEDVDPDDSLREQLDLDSMDFLRFVQELNARLGVDVPELDYPQLDSLSDAVRYLEARV